MQAKKRYILVFVSCAFLAYCYFGGYRLKTSSGGRGSSSSALMQHRKNRISSTALSAAAGGSELYQHLPSYFSSAQINNNLIIQTKSNTEGTTNAASATACRMDNCFDFGKCMNDFLVYVYPPEPANSLGSTPPISANYQKILTAIIESRYYTPNPDKACLFVLGIDTLDRDTLSEDFVRNVPSRLLRLSHWNNGRNHIIFNLYSGTWPDYAEQSLGFDTGEAILAKASMSVLQMRPDFDISIPLFHKQFPLRAGASGLVQTNSFPANKKYLLAFKGKR